jgi:hypothetical protein
LQPAVFSFRCGVTSAPAKPPNQLLELALTIIIPSLVLDKLSAPSSLGPFWALVVSLIFPLGFGAWCWWQRLGWNLFSILGLVTILLSGSLGLLKLDGFWFAIKESAMPIIIGVAFPLSHRFGKPLINALLMQPQIFNLPALQKALQAPEKKKAFDAALFKASCGMGLGMFGSSISNFFLALYLLKDKVPGSEAFVKSIGTLNWAGMLVIGIPLMGVMMLLFFWLINQMQKITGLEKDDLMNPGETVRRQVGKPQA